MPVLWQDQHSPTANGLKSCSSELKAGGITTWLGGNLGSCICQAARKIVHAYPASKASLAAQTERTQRSFFFFLQHDGLLTYFDTLVQCWKVLTLLQHWGTLGLFSYLPLLLGFHTCWALLCFFFLPSGSIWISKLVLKKQTNKSR